MKKILAIIFVILLSAMPLLGCAAPTPTITLDPTRPWGAYERSVYDVEIVERVETDDSTIDGRTFADGTLTFELKHIRQDGLDIVVLTTDFTITYRSEDYVGQDAGLTDTITSEVRFLRDGCDPISSSKTAEFAVRKAADGAYSANDSYSYTADYITREAVSYKGKDVNTQSGEKLADYIEEKTINLNATGKFFDNEQLFFIVRTMSDVKPESGVNFNISNIYAIADNINAKGKYSLTPFYASAAVDLVPVVVDPNVFNGYDVSTTSGTISCMATTIAIAERNSGPSFSVYYTDPSLTIVNNAMQTQTCKVLVKMETLQYNLMTAKDEFRTTYTLREYSNFSA